MKLRNGLQKGASMRVIPMRASLGALLKDLLLWTTGLKLPVRLRNGHRRGGNMPRM